MASLLIQAYLCRTENESCVTASNLFKYAFPCHGLVLFKHHNPLQCSEAQVRNLSQPASYSKDLPSLVILAGRLCKLTLHCCDKNVCIPGTLVKEAVSVSADLAGGRSAVSSLWMVPKGFQTAQPCAMALVPLELPAQSRCKPVPWPRPGKPRLLVLPPLISTSEGCHCGSWAGVQIGSKDCSKSLPRVRS